MPARRPVYPVLFALVASLLALVGAGCVYLTGEFACEDDSHCPSWLACREGICRDPGADGGPPSPSPSCEGLEVRSGSIFLRVASDVQSFASEGTACVRLEGSLVVTASDLTDLVGLERLVEVTGSLVVTDNARLVSLAGLSSLASIGVDLEVRNNGALADVSHLSALEEVGGEVDIRDNPSLAQADALALVAQLTHVGGEARVRDNGE